MKIKVVNDSLREKYELIPRMLSEKLNTEIEYIDRTEYYDHIRGDDYVWHFYIRNSTQHRWNSKIFQYETLNKIINIPKFITYKSLVPLIYDFKNLKKRFKKFLITSDYGNSGESFLYCTKRTTIVELMDKFKPTERLRVSKYIKGCRSLSFHLIIAGENYFYASPIVEQHINGITEYAGGRYPTDICYINGMEQEISNVLARDGYRGLAHIDILIDGNGEIYFCEINPRTAASTPYLCCSLELEYGINLPYVEYCAVQKGVLPEEIFNKRKKIVEWDFKIIDGSMPDMLVKSPLELRKLFKRSGHHYIKSFKKDKYIRLSIKNDSEYNL